MILQLQMRTYLIMKIILIAILFLLSYFLMKDYNEHYNTVAFLDAKASWVAKRLELQNETSQKKVLLLAYMRGGSSILGEVFKSNPDVYYSFEPLDALYSNMYGKRFFQAVEEIYFFQNFTQRQIPPWEKQLIVEFLQKQYNGDYAALPVEALTHPRIWREGNFRELASCLKGHIKGFDRSKGSYGCNKGPIRSLCNGCLETNLMNMCAENIFQLRGKYGLHWSHGVDWSDTSFSVPSDKHYAAFDKHASCLAKFDVGIKKCNATLSPTCSTKRLLVNKIIRLTMETAKEILEKIPDLFIIYSVRDPRDTALSRFKAHLSWKGSHGDPALEVKMLCKKMRNDLKHYHSLIMQYPEAIKLVHYEDLILHTNKTVKEIYAHFDELAPSVIFTKLQNLIHSTDGKDHKPFSQQRSNGTQSVQKWRKTLSPAKKAEMTGYCWDVLLELGYPLE